MRNIGSFDSPFRVENELPPEIQIPKMIEICDPWLFIIIFNLEAFNMKFVKRFVW